MVSTQQVLQVPQGGKQVMKGVHAYMENILLFHCILILLQSKLDSHYIEFT